MAHPSTHRWHARWHHRPKASGFEVFERAGYVGNLRDRQVHDRASRRLVGGDCHLGSAFVGDDDARGTHDLGGTHDGAEITGIGHMVEHHNERRTVGGGGGDDIGKVRVGEPAHLEHDTLMRPVTGDGVKLCAGDALDVHACLAKAREQLTDSRFALHSLGDEARLMGKPVRSASNAARRPSM